MRRLTGFASGVDARAAILMLKAHDFASREQHAEADRRSFATLAAHHIPLVDEDVATAVAEAIAHRPDCPAAVRDALLDRRDGAALIVIARAAGLDSMRRAAALGAGRGEALALAGRADLDAEAIAILLAREETDVTEALLRNAAAVLPAQAVAILIDQGRRDPRLGRLLLDRGEEIGPRRAALFLAADPAARRAMLARIAAQARLDAGAPVHTLADVEMRALETAALSGDRHMFAARLADAATIDIEVAVLIAEDRHGEALAVALRAVAMPDVIAERCLLFLATQSGAGAEAALALARLHRTLDVATSRRLLALMAGEVELPAVDEGPAAEPHTIDRNRQHRRAVDPKDARRPAAAAPKLSRTGSSRAP